MAVPSTNVAVPVSDERRQSFTAAEMIVERLCETGLDTFFGIPGGPVIPFFDAILTNPRATLIEPRHESHGIFAAMGFYRASGRTPVMVVTAGPGATNIVTGVVAAHLERIPIVVISGDVAWAATGQKLLQDVGPDGIGIAAMLQRVCRAVVRVSHAHSAGAMVERAIQAATDPANPGPSLVVVSIDRSGSRGDWLDIVAPPASPRTHAPPSEATLSRLVDQLRSAKRPLLVVGAGCRDAAPRIQQLVDAIGVPFMTTPQAKGIVSEDHPLSLRNGGMGASWWARTYTEGAAGRGARARHRSRRRLDRRHSAHWGRRIAHARRSRSFGIRPQSPHDDGGRVRRRQLRERAVEGLPTRRPNRTGRRARGRRSRQRGL